MNNCRGGLIMIIIRYRGNTMEIEGAVRTVAYEYDEFGRLRKTQKEQQNGKEISEKTMDVGF